MRIGDDSAYIIDIEQALADYTKRVQVNLLEKYPVMWAGHYAGDHRLGEFTVSELPDVPDAAAKVVLGMMSPFGMTPEISASVLVIDALRVPMPAPFETSRVLYVSRLAITGRGILASHWTVGLNDRGFAQPERTAWAIPGVWLALSDIENRRLAGATLSFDDAFSAALDVAREVIGDETA
jgi:hypothetical protein